MEHAIWDFDFRETKLKGYFDLVDEPDFEEIYLHRIGTWYAVKMRDHYAHMRLCSDRPQGEYFFGL